MKVGDFELGGEIGRGGVGRVLRGRAADGRDVAVKVLIDRNPDRVARFEREARLLGALGEVEGFVPLLGTGVDPQLGPWVAMPFLTGGTLRDRLRRGPLGTDEGLSLARSLASALGQAHARGIVHRDVKPENVLFTGDGRPLVSDLGLAKHFARDVPGASQSAALSKSGAIRGTLAYMAPEQLQDTKRVGPAADVYSLAVLLYEALAGRPPFQGSTLVELMTNVEARDFAPLARTVPGVPAALALAIERGLAPVPGERPADGNAFAALLDEAAGRGRWRVALVAPALGLVAASVFAATRGRTATPGLEVAPVLSANARPERPTTLAALLELDRQGGGEAELGAGAHAVLKRELEPSPSGDAVAAFAAKHRSCDDVQLLCAQHLLALGRPEFESALRNAGSSETAKDLRRAVKAWRDLVEPIDKICPAKHEYRADAVLEAVKKVETAARRAGAASKGWPDRVVNGAAAPALVAVRAMFRRIWAQNAPPGDFGPLYSVLPKDQGVDFALVQSRTQGRPDQPRREEIERLGRLASRLLEIDPTFAAQVLAFASADAADLVHADTGVSKDLRASLRELARAALAAARGAAAQVLAPDSPLEKDAAHRAAYESASGASDLLAELAFRARADAQAEEASESLREALGASFVSDATLAGEGREGVPAATRADSLRRTIALSFATGASAERIRELMDRPGVDPLDRELALAEGERRGDSGACRERLEALLRRVGRGPEAPRVRAEALAILARFVDLEALDPALTAKVGDWRKRLPRLLTDGRSADEAARDSRPR